MYNRLLNAREARRSESGFTLIELLIVIVVLGILAGIVVFGVSSFRSDATAAACNADQKTVEVAAEAFNAKTGAYPTAMADLLPKTVNGVTTPGYLKAAPTTVTLGADGVVTKIAAKC